MSRYNTLCDVGGATGQLAIIMAQKHHHLRCVTYDLPMVEPFVAIENIIDDERRKNAFGFMMSLNILIEFGEAFDFTGADFTEWCKEVGFKRTEIIPLGGPASAAVAYK